MLTWYFPREKKKEGHFIFFFFLISSCSGKMVEKKELIKTSVWTLLMAHLLEYWLSTQSLREAWKPGDGSGFADCQVWNFLC